MRRCRHQMRHAHEWSVTSPCGGATGPYAGSLLLYSHHLIEVRPTTCRRLHAGGCGFHLIVMRLISGECVASADMRVDVLG